MRCAHCNAQPANSSTHTGLCTMCDGSQPQTAFIASQTPCQQCGYPLDNTGTICNACIAAGLGMKAVQRPILIGKGTPVSAPSTTYVECKISVLIGVEPNGGIATVIIPPNAERAATGKFFANDSAGNLVTAGVPEPPPRFNSPEEADEWLEANAGRAGGFDVEITQDQATIALAAADSINDITDWL